MALDRLERISPMDLRHGCKKPYMLLHPMTDNAKRYTMNLGVHNNAHSSTTTPNKINHFTTTYRLYMSISIELVCEDDEDGHCTSVIKGEVCEN